MSQTRMLCPLETVELTEIFQSKGWRISFFADEYCIEICGMNDATDERLQLGFEPAATWQEIIAAISAAIK